MVDEKETNENLIETKEDIKNEQEDNEVIENTEEIRTEEKQKHKKKEKHAKEGLSNFATAVIVLICSIIAVLTIDFCYLVLIDKIKI